MIPTQAMGLERITLRHPLSSRPSSVTLIHFSKTLRFAFSNSFPTVVMSSVPRKTRRRRSSTNTSSSLGDNFNIKSSPASVAAASASSAPQQPDKVPFISYSFPFMFFLLLGFVFEELIENFFLIYFFINHYIFIYTFWIYYKVIL